MTKYANYNIVGDDVVVTWTDGVTTRHPVQEIHADCRNPTLALGAQEKLRDKTASVGAKTGSVVECRNAVMECWENLKTGIFDSRGASNGGIWVEAIVRAFPEKKYTIAKISAVWATLPEKTKKNDKTEPSREFYRKHPLVAAAKTEIERARILARNPAANVVDDDILAVFGPTEETPVEPVAVEEKARKRG